MRGRKPKPTTLKLVEGNPGKRSLNPAEPRFEQTVPACPEWLDDEAKREWMRIGIELQRAGLVAAAYAGAMAVYCQAWSDFRAAVQLLHEEGATYTTEKGAVVQHPAVGMKNRAMQLLLKAGAEFGLSPSAASRVSTGKTDEPRDELQDFLRRGEKRSA